MFLIVGIPQLIASNCSAKLVQLKKAAIAIQKNPKNSDAIAKMIELLRKPAIRKYVVKNLELDNPNTIAAALALRSVEVAYAPITSPILTHLTGPSMNGFENLDTGEIYEALGDLLRYSAFVENWNSSSRKISILKAELYYRNALSFYDKTAFSAFLEKPRLEEKMELLTTDSPSSHIRIKNWNLAHREFKALMNASLRPTDQQLEKAARKVLGSIMSLTPSDIADYLEFDSSRLQGAIALTRESLSLMRNHLNIDDRLSALAHLLSIEILSVENQNSLAEIIKASLEDLEFEQTQSLAMPDLLLAGRSQSSWAWFLLAGSLIRSKISELHSKKTEEARELFNGLTTLKTHGIQALESDVEFFKGTRQNQKKNVRQFFENLEIIKVKTSNGSL